MSQVSCTCPTSRAASCTHTSRSTVFSHTGGGGERDVGRDVRVCSGLDLGSEPFLLEFSLTAMSCSPRCSHIAVCNLQCDNYITIYTLYVMLNVGVYWAKSSAVRYTGPDCFLCCSPAVCAPMAAHSDANLYGKPQCTHTCTCTYTLCTDCALYMTYLKCTSCEAGTLIIRHSTAINLRVSTGRARACSPHAHSSSLSAPR